MDSAMAYDPIHKRILPVTAIRVSSLSWTQSTDT